MNSNDGVRSSLFGDTKKNDRHSNLSDPRDQMPLTEMDELKKKLKILLVAREQLKQQNDELANKVADYERKFDKMAEENQMNMQKYHEAVSQKSFYMNLYQSLQKKNEELEAKLSAKATEVPIAPIQMPSTTMPSDRYATSQVSAPKAQYDIDVNETSLQLGKIILDAQISASQIKKRAKEEADKYYRETVQSLAVMLDELKESRSNLIALKGNLNDSMSIFGSGIEDMCGKIDNAINNANEIPSSN